MITDAIVRWIDARTEVKRKQACMHNWEVEYEVRITGDGWVAPRGSTVGHKVIYACSKCGEFKTIKL